MNKKNSKIQCRIYTSSDLRDDDGMVSYSVGFIRKPVNPHCLYRQYRGVLSLAVILLTCTLSPAENGKTIA